MVTVMFKDLCQEILKPIIEELTRSNEIINKKYLINSSNEIINKIGNNDPSITCLTIGSDIQQYNLSNKQIKKLAFALRYNNKLTSIYLCDKEYSPDVVNALIDGLKSNNSLTTLYFKNMQLSNELLKQIEAKLKENQNERNN